MHQVILENQFHCTRLYSCILDNSWIFTGRHFVAPDITHVLIPRLLHPYGDQVQCIQSTDVCPARWLQNTVRQITLPTKLARKTACKCPNAWSFQPICDNRRLKRNGTKEREALGYFRHRWCCVFLPSPCTYCYDDLQYGCVCLPAFSLHRGMSLILRLFVLDTFLSSAISSQFLQNVNTDFSTVRQSGYVGHFPGLSTGHFWEKCTCCHNYYSCLFGFILGRMHFFGLILGRMHFSGLYWVGCIFFFMSNDVTSWLWLSPHGTQYVACMREYAVVQLTK